MKIIDLVITSKIFEWIFSFITKRKKFLNLKEVYSVFGEPERRAYSEIYGEEAAIKVYGRITHPYNSEEASSRSCESHHHAKRRVL